MRSLNEEEIQEVQEILHESHPLYYGGLRIGDLLGPLKYISFFNKKRAGVEIGGPITETNKILPADIERSDEPVKPFSYDSEEISKSMHILGFGTVAYLDFHRYLVMLYAIIVALLLPSLTLFLFYGDGRRTGSSFFTKFTIANLGFTSTLCRDVTFAVGDLTLTCPSGRIGEIVSFGIIPAEGKINDACLPNEETVTCDSVIDFDFAEKEIKRKCIGKPYCTINAKQLVSSTGPEECLSKYAQFYTQVYCDFLEDAIETRNNLSIWFSVQILLTTFVILSFLFFMRRRTSKEYTEWDMQTTTASDYTMQYNIPDKIFTDFRDNIYKQNRKLTMGKASSTGPVLQKSSKYIESGVSFSGTENNEQGSLVYDFKLYLKNEFEAILRDTEHVKFRDNSLVNISHIHLGFDHVKLHDMLQKRGDALKGNKVEKKEKIEKEIVEYIHKNKDYISTPRDAYIIFETEE
jgi:hypothetical protein